MGHPAIFSNSDSLQYSLLLSKNIFSFSSTLSTEPCFLNNFKNVLIYSLHLVFPITNATEPKSDPNTPRPK